MLLTQALESQLVLSIASVGPAPLRIPCASVPCERDTRHTERVRDTSGSFAALASLDLWHDLRAVTSETRLDWDLGKPGLRESWDAGDLSPFHGWDTQAAPSGSEA